MKEKDRYLFTEFLFTFFLLLLVVFLFGEVLSGYGLYLTLGLIAGFSFSWLNRNQQSSLIRVFISIGAVGICVWLIYSLVNSSFLYQEVILIFIKGGIFLEIILSFDSALASSLTSIQALSLPLFMCSPLFVKHYDEIQVILVLIYFVCWIVILKIKFYEFLKPAKQGNSKRYYSIFLSLAIFLVIILISRLLFDHFLLGRIEKGGLLSEESNTVKIKEDALEKEYYDLQDKVQKEISRLIPNFKYKEDRHQALYLLSSLIKESPNIMEVKKAEHGLIDRLKRLGPGLEKMDAEKLTLLIKSYLDKKIAINLKRARDNIMHNLKNNPFSIKERISILERVNKMQDSNSYQQIRRYEREAKKIIDNSLVTINVIRELKKSIRQIKEFKTLALYRRRMDSFDKKIGSLDEQSKKEFASLSSDIDTIEKLSDFKEIEIKIEKLKEQASLQRKDLIKQAEEITDLRLEMLLSEKATELKNKLESFNLPEHNLRQLKEELDNIKDAEDPRSFSKDVLKFQEKIQEGNIHIPEDIKDLLEIKIPLFIKKNKERIKEMLKESILPDLGKGLLNDLEKIELHKEDEKVISDIQRLKENIEKFLNQGFVSEGTKDNLIKEIEDIKDLLLLKFKVEREAEGKEIPRPMRQVNYQQELKELIEKSSLKEEKKEIFQRFTERLFKAQTFLQVKNIKEAVEKEIETSVKEGLKKEETKKITDGFGVAIEIQKMFIIDKALSALRKKIEDLKKVSPQEAEKINEYLQKIRDSATKEELKKEIDALKDYLSSKGGEQELEKKPQEIKEENPWHIYILPSRIVLSKGSSVSLRAVAIYNNIFIKELSSELEWFSSKAGVAEVDKKGIIYVLSKGKTRISSKYRGRDSDEAEVIVVDETAEEMDGAVKKELAR